MSLANPGVQVSVWIECVDGGYWDEKATGLRKPDMERYCFIVGTGMYIFPAKKVGS